MNVLVLVKAKSVWIPDSFSESHGNYLNLGLFVAGSKRAIKILSLLLHNTGCLLNLGCMPLSSLLSRSIPMLDDLVCNEAMFMSASVSKQLFMAVLTNPRDASACPLL